LKYLTKRGDSVEYIIKPGDTVSVIAARFGVTLAVIFAANPQITSSNQINAGQRINIPTPQHLPYSAGLHGVTGRYFI
jgi:LysM repeat protein